MAYRYRTTLRPPGFGGLPQGVRWHYVELPSDGLLGRRPNDKLPLSRHLYGVVETERELTPQECAHFDIVEVPVPGLGMVLEEE